MNGQESSLDIQARHSSETFDSLIATRYEKRRVLALLHHFYVEYNRREVGLYKRSTNMTIHFHLLI